MRMPQQIFMRALLIMQLDIYVCFVCLIVVASIMSHSFHNISPTQSPFFKLRTTANQLNYRSEITSRMNRYNIYLNLYSCE